MKVPAMTVGIAQRIHLDWVICAPDTPAGEAWQMTVGEESLEQAHIGQQASRGSRKALADARDWLCTPVQQKHPTEWREIERGGRSGGTRAENGDVDFQQVSARSPPGKRCTFSIIERSVGWAARSVGVSYRTERVAAASASNAASWIGLC